MIEVKVKQAFPGQIDFINECDEKEVVEVVYKWKPVSYTAYKGMGHTQGQCQKPLRQIWRQKSGRVPVNGAKEPAKDNVASVLNLIENNATIDEEGFKEVRRPTRRSLNVAPTPEVQNGFEVLVNQTHGANVQVEDIVSVLKGT